MCQTTISYRFVGVKMPRNPEYCCLRKLEGNGKKCLKRIKGAKIKLSGETWKCFTEFVGDEEIRHFSPNDFICPSCDIKVNQ